MPLNTRTIITWSLGATLYIACGNSITAHAQEPIGATRFLKAFEDQSRQQKGSAYTTLITDIQAYQQRASTLSPQEATAQWLKLLDRYYELLKGNQGGGMANFSIMAESLPPPSAWEALIIAIRARKPADAKAKKQEKALQMFASVLEGNQARILQESKDFEKSFPDPQLLDILPNIQQLLTVKDEAAMGQKTERILKRLRDRIKERVQGNEQRNRFRGGGGFGGREGGFDVGDLVAEINVLRTAPFLKEIFTTVPLEFTFPPNTKTFELAQRVAMENIDKLMRPQWFLAATPNNIALFEAMEQRFPPPKILKKPDQKPEANGIPQPDEEMPFAPSQRSALNYYILSLLQKGKTQQATARVEQEGVLENNGLFDESFNYQYGYQSRMRVNLEDQKRVYTLLKGILQKKPTLGYWTALLRYGQLTHQLPQLQSLFLQAFKQPNLTLTLRSDIEKGVYTIYLHKDQVDEAAGLLKTILARPKPKQKSRSYYSYISGSILSPVSSLLTLGDLCDRTEWVQEALKFAKQKKSEEYDPYANLADELVAMGRYPLAEQHLWEIIQRDNQNGGSNVVQTLVQLYHKMKRYGDILLLMDRYPDWDKTDLVDLDSGHSLHFYVANALSKVGRNPEAIPILEHILRSSTTSDWRRSTDNTMDALELFIEIQGTKASPYLDKLLAVKPDANELLYGKALLAQKAGNLKEAETQALLAFNPYTNIPDFEEQQALPLCRLLQRLAEQLKQPADKETYTKIERAILLMERAKRYTASELTARASKCYREAFVLAPNLACVRQAMAQLAEEDGQIKEAEAHYQALTEAALNATSRATSRFSPFYLRFGWRMMWRYYDSLMNEEEGSSLRSRVQERLYTSLLAKEPKNAKYAYLLATVRIRQKRFGDAVKLLQEATKLDPTLDPAWRALLNIAEQSPLPIPDQESIALRLFQSSHSAEREDSPTLAQVHDLKKLWKSAETFQNLRLPALPQSLYVLREAKFRKQMNNRDDSFDFYEYRHRRSGDYGVPTPGQILSQHPLVSAVCNFIDYMRYTNGNDNEEENGEK